jgi:hypothetical protein
MFPLEPHFVPYALPKLSSSKVYIAGQMLQWCSWNILHWYSSVYLFILELFRWWFPSSNPKEK